MKRRLRRSLVLFLIVFVALMVSGWFNQWRIARLYAQYPQIGRDVPIGSGRTLNFYCSGEGTPVVIFETFSHQAGFSWSAVQPRVARFTRACWYDRAGYGWSKAGPLPRTFEATATDLHALVQAASVTKPFVLVGSYDAVSVIRVYSRKYPRDVAAGVFIDGNTPEVYAHEVTGPEGLKGPWEQTFGRFAPSARGAFCRALPIVSPILSRLPKLGQPRRTQAFGLPADERAKLDFLSDRSAEDSCQASVNLAAVRAAGDFGDRRLVVLASAHQLRSGGKDDAKSIDDWNSWWVTQAQPTLAALSSQGRLVIVTDRVDLESVVSAVHDVVSDLRDDQSHKQ